MDIVNVSVFFMSHRRTTCIILSIWIDFYYFQVYSLESEVHMICKGCFSPLTMQESLVADKHDPFLRRFPSIDSGYCRHCRVNCPYCEDWMRGLPEMVMDGRRVHAECFAEILRDLEEEERKLCPQS